MPYNQFNTVGELIDYATKWGRCTKKRKVLINICYGTLWGIWKAKNERLFKKLITTPTKVVDNIQSMVYNFKELGKNL